MTKQIGGRTITNRGQAQKLADHYHKLAMSGDNNGLALKRYQELAKEFAECAASWKDNKAETPAVTP